MPTPPQTKSYYRYSPGHVLYLTGTTVFLLTVFMLSWFPTSDVLPKEVDDYLETGRFLTINDGKGYTRVFVKEEPHTDDIITSNEAILLLHGVLSTSFTWRHSLASIHQQTGLRAIAIDLPGLGLSDKKLNRPYDFHYYTTVVEEIVKSFGINRVHLVLDDISGLFGSEFAVKNSGQIASITYLPTFLDVAEYQQPLLMRLLHVPIAKEFVFQLMTSNLFAPLSYLIFKNQFSDTMPYDTFRAYTYLLRHQNGKQTLFEIINNLDLRPEYGNYLKDGLNRNCAHIPKQLIWSEHDSVVESKKQASFIANHISGVSRHTWFDTKHLIAEDQPQEFSDCLSSFINDHKSK